MPSILNAPLSGGVTITSDTSGILQLQTASTAALTITAAQNVGIGTASPAARLDVRVTGTGARIYGGGETTSTLELGGLSTGADNATISATNNIVLQVDNNNNVGGRTFSVRNGGKGYTDGTLLISTGINNSLSLQGATPKAGTGITFPATQSASSDANTLDDYEEGTWTATDASGAGLSLSGTTQRYTKVGRLVTILIDNIGFPSTANGNSISIGGLPFVAGAAVASGGISNYTGSTVQFFIAAGESNIRLYNTPSLFTRTTNAQMSTNSFYTSITYSV
jgi:hypothetical protein